MKPKKRVKRSWVFVGACCWTLMIVIWVRRFLEIRFIISTGISSAYSSWTALIPPGILVLLSLFLAFLYWRGWLLYDKYNDRYNDKNS